MYKSINVYTYKRIYGGFMANPTFFRDDAAVAARTPEVSNASWTTGMNNGGSNACGVGINAAGGAVVGTPDQFTLLDQKGLARTGQRSQSIGGYPFVAAAAYPSSGGTEGTAPDAVIFIGTVSSNGDGSAVVTGNATLADLATGWTAVP
jgi:hypothetical protein